jgi:hypothetical protein
MQNDVMRPLKLGISQINCIMAGASKKKGKPIDTLAKKRKGSGSSKKSKKAKEVIDVENNSKQFEWLTYFFEELPFEEKTMTLSTAIDPDNPPETVRRCVAHSVSESLGHKEYFVVPDRNRNYDDRRHFESYHPSIVKIMDTTQNEDLKQASTECIAFMKQKFQRQGLRNWLTTGLPDYGKLSKTQTVSLAFMLWFVEAEIPFNATEHKMWPNLMTVLEAQSYKRTTLTKIMGAVYEYVRKQREESIHQAGFFHALFDFYNCMGKEVLLINYQILLENGTIKQFPLDVVPFPGRQFASTICSHIDACVKSHTNEGIFRFV